MLVRRLVIGCLAAAACACAQSKQAKSSETHFLALCSDGACGEGLRCVCGVCSLPCTDDDACSELAAQAECSAAAAADCAGPRVCDATCEHDADCASLSDQHTCESGRCRAPLAAGAGSCERDGKTYADGESFPASDGCNQCTCSDGSVSCTEEGCGACAPGECRLGDRCLAEGESAPGIGDDWCNTCECNAGVLACTDAACAPRPIDTPPCEPRSCEYYGVCYPPGSGTEDGCCGCATEAQQQAGVGSGCIEPAWCPGRPDIGSRCGDMATGCAMGLTCRTDFFGERPICARACNYGCPTGTECVAEVPGYDGGVIRNVCLRTCTTQADCTFAEGLGTDSECDMPPGLDRRYCF